MSKEQISEGEIRYEPTPVESSELERHQVFDVAVRAFQNFTQTASRNDRPITIEIRYYLQAIQRTGTPSLHEAEERLRERARHSEISSALRALLLDTARRLRALNSNIENVQSGYPSVRAAMPVMKEQGETGHKKRVEVPSESISETYATEDARRAALRVHRESDVHRAEQEYRERWRKIFAVARHAAETYVKKHMDLETAFPETQEVLVSMKQALFETWGIPNSVIGTEYTDAFFSAYIGVRRQLVLASPKEEMQNAENDEVLVFDTEMADAVGLACRVEAMSRALHTERYSMDMESDSPTDIGARPAVRVPVHESSEIHVSSPEELFGISASASRSDIERAFAEHVQMLDFDRVEDRKEIAKLQKAREQLLVRAEAREQEAASRREEEKRKAQEDADRAHYAWMTKPIEKPVASEVVLPNNTEGWWSRALRSPGAKIRAALFGTVAVGAGALALHEFGENDTDPSHVVVGALEDPKIDDGSAESFGVDLEGDKDTEGRGPAMAQRIEERNVDHVTASKDTLWKVLSDRIRARGLRPTHEKIMTLKHYADLENPGVDWETLQVGQVIHLKQVEGMLDEMEGKPVVAPLPDAGFRSVLTGEPESVLENIPASTFEQAVAQLQQQHAEEQARWYSELSTADHEPIAAKAYEDIPREGHTNHVMAKGEWIYKLIHLMLRDSGLNWSTPRITKLKNMTLQENGLSEEQARKIPVGATITFDSAVREIQAMKAVKERGKKK